MTHPNDAEIERYTDHYFNRTKQVIGKFGDSRVTYAIFMRRPVVFAPRLALEWLEEIGRSRNTTVEIDLRYIEGKWVGAGEPMMYITGSFFHLVDLETIFLQKLGPGLRRGLQRLDDVRRHAEVGLPRHGCAPLRRPGDGRDDGLCRLGRLGPRQAQGRRAWASSATPRTPPRISSAATRGSAPCRTP